MNDVMHHIHQMTETLQSLEFKVVDAMVIIQSTVQLLKKIRDDHDTVSQEIDDGIKFLRKLGNDDPEEVFQRKHCVRKEPIQFDPKQHTAKKISLHQFY